MTRDFSAALALALFVALPGAAAAQEFPTRPVHYIVPYSPGTGQDLIARLLAPEMSKTLGQPVLVENRPGATTIIGYESVAKAPADGYTIAATLVTDLVTLPVTVKDLRFDPIKDLPPIIGLAEGRFVLVSSTTMPWKSFDDLVAAAKASPGKLNYGAASVIGRLSTEAVLRGRGLDVLFVPYSNGAAYVKALAAGEVQIGFLAAAAANGLGERARILATTGDKRMPALPDAATFGELGFPHLRGLSHAIHGPAGIPRATFQKLQGAAQAALQRPEIRAGFAKLQLEIVEQPPEVAARRAAEEAAFLADVAKKVGIQPQ
jgi:tripartite-type tricarboxylate transporter receptor subunit TctC